MDGSKVSEWAYHQGKREKGAILSRPSQFYSLALSLSFVFVGILMRNSFTEVVR